MTLITILKTLKPDLRKWFENHIYNTETTLTESDSMVTKQQEMACMLSFAINVKQMTENPTEKSLF